MINSYESETEPSKWKSTRSRELEPSKIKKERLVLALQHSSATEKYFLSHAVSVFQELPIYLLASIIGQVTLSLDNRSYR